MAVALAARSCAHRAPRNGTWAEVYGRDCGKNQAAMSIQRPCVAAPGCIIEPANLREPPACRAALFCYFQRCRHEGRHPPQLPHDQGRHDQWHGIRHPFDLRRGRCDPPPRHRSQHPPGMDRRLTAAHGPRRTPVEVQCALCGIRPRGEEVEARSNCSRRAPTRLACSRPR